MSDLRIDLTNCDREAIHIPGNIQSHGFILAVDRQGIICYCSENISRLTGSPSAELPGSQISDFISYITPKDLLSPIPALLLLCYSGHDPDQLNPCPLNIFGEDFNLIISPSGFYMLLELEPALLKEQGRLQKLAGKSLARMLTNKNLSDTIFDTAIQIRAVIGFDRVMVYRFAPDGHGEVIGESREDALASWIGQHFPASDIPKQARELYKLNLTRLIANVENRPSGLLALEGLEPLDLTHAQLRAVSPIHIQYLKNMGVASSFSISLIYKTELWGLIACHNYAPKYIEFSSREAAKLIGQVLSSALEFRQDEMDHKTHETFNAHLDNISRQLISGDIIVDALISGESNILSIVHATGALLVYEKTTVKIGIVPDDGQITSLISWLETNLDNPIYHTDQLESVFPAATEFRKIASGLFLLLISRELGEYIVFFKPEQLSTISWAGDPEKENKRKNNSLAEISPRNSFESWKETVVGKSMPWSPEEIQSVSRLKQEISYAVNIKANAVRLLNDRLTAAYQELNTFSYTISHDLKNPVSSLKAYAQLLQRDDSLNERSRRIALHMESGADRMNRMIGELLEYSRIGRAEPDYATVEILPIVSQICEEMKVVHHLNPPTFVFESMQDLHGDSVMIESVFSNLIGNAVKYSQGSDNPTINISSVIEGNQVRFSIRDNGIGIRDIDLPRIFDLFSRMSNVGDIEGSGVGLAIVKRIVERHGGKIWAECPVEGGTEFHVCFNQLKKQ